VSEGGASGPVFPIGAVVRGVLGQRQAERKRKSEERAVEEQTRRDTLEHKHAESLAVRVEGTRNRWEVPVGAPGLFQAISPWAGQRVRPSAEALARDPLGLAPTARGREIPYPSSIPSAGGGERVAPYVLRATAVGAPPGTGSGIPGRDEYPPPPTPQGVGYDLVAFSNLVLDLLRRFGVRLPWDPRAPKGAPVSVFSIDFPDFNIDFPTFPADYGAGPGVFYDAPVGGAGGGGMANVWGSILNYGGELLGGVLRGANQPGGGPWSGGYGGVLPMPTLAMPGGSPLVPSISDLGGVMATQGAGGLSTPWAPGRTGARAKTFVVPNPVTGSPVWFKPAGRPVLWSGDLATCKRVRKIAGHARRRLGGR